MAPTPPFLLVICLMFVALNLFNLFCLTKQGNALSSFCVHELTLHVRSHLWYKKAWQDVHTSLALLVLQCLSGTSVHSARHGEFDPCALWSTH